jgi:hypothetical protein
MQHVSGHVPGGLPIKRIRSKNLKAGPRAHV